MVDSRLTKAFPKVSVYRKSNSAFFLSSGDSSLRKKHSIQMTSLLFKIGILIAELNPLSWEIEILRKLFSSDTSSSDIRLLCSQVLPINPTPLENLWNELNFENFSKYSSFLPQNPDQMRYSFLLSGIQISPYGQAAVVQIALTKKSIAELKLPQRFNPEARDSTSSVFIYIFNICKNKIDFQI